MQCIIFDLDGTLVDTAPDLMAVADEMLRQLHAPPLPRSAGRLAAGQGARAMLTLGLRAGRVPLPSEADWPPLIEEFIRRYEARMTERSRPFKGVPELLERLAGQGLKLAVCTNKREALARKLLDALGLGGYFKGIIGGDSLPHRKPHPAPVQRAAELAGAQPRHSMMLGDSRADIQAAYAAGALPVLAAWGYVKEPLADYEAAHTCHSPAEVESLLSEIASSG